MLCLCFFKHKTAYESRISDWSSYLCSSDLPVRHLQDISVRIGDIGPVTNRRPPIFGAFQQYAGVTRPVCQPVDLGTAGARNAQMPDRAECPVLQPRLLDQTDDERPRLVADPGDYIAPARAVSDRKSVV